MVPGHRYANIDALRGVAALLVLVLHASEVFVQAPALDGRGRAWHDVASAIDLGRAGVVAFFLISGFVVPATLDGAPREALRRFWIRRACRLYPAFWLSIPLGYWALWSLAGRPFTVGDVAANATMLPALLGREATIGLYWTLETELAFYALCSALFLAGGLHRIRALLALQVVLVAGAVVLRIEPAWRPPLAQWTLLPHSLAVMIGGTVCRAWFEARGRLGPAHPRTRRAARDAALALALPLLPAIAYGWVSARHGAPAVAAGYATGFALFVATIVWLQRPPSPVVGLGTVSYSIYLLHPVALYLVAITLQGATVPAPIGAGTMTLVVAMAAVALAAASYRLVELPAIRLGRRLTQRPVAPTQGAGVAREPR